MFSRQPKEKKVPAVNVLPTTVLGPTALKAPSAGCVDKPHFQSLS